MIQSRIVLEWQAQARAEGRADALLDALEAMFKQVPDDLAAKVRAQTNMAVLKAWTVLVVQATSLDQFRRDASL